MTHIILNNRFFIDEEQSIITFKYNDQKNENKYDLLYAAILTGMTNGHLIRFFVCYNNSDTFFVDLKQLSYRSIYQNKPIFGLTENKLSKLLHCEVKLQPGVPDQALLNESKEAISLWTNEKRTPKELFYGFWKQDSYLRKLHDCLWARRFVDNFLQEGAFYTPEPLIEKAVKLVQDHWEFDQVWDPMAGDGRIVKEFKNKTQFASDINAEFKIPGSFVQNAYDLSWTPPGFSSANGIIVSNPSFQNNGCNNFYEMCIRRKCRFAFFFSDWSLTNKSRPAVDGFYSFGGTDWKTPSEGGIVFMLFDPLAPLIDSIVIPSTIKDLMNTYQFTPPSNAFTNVRGNRTREISIRNRSLKHIESQIGKHNLSLIENTCEFLYKNRLYYRYEKKTFGQFPGPYNIPQPGTQ